MNYANMIEEKSLKKTFIIATLCSTIIGTFSSSIGLWDRVKERRKQQKRDFKQDNEIKALRDKVEATDRRSSEVQQRLQPPPPRDRDEVGDAFQRSGAIIRREFDEGYERYGRRFAVGDPMTENRLQAQIIALQQTVINVLQDALYDNRQLTRADMARLVAASDAAREGSLDALRQQQRRIRAIDAPTPYPSTPRPRSFSPPPSSTGSSIRRRRSMSSRAIMPPEPEPVVRELQPQPLPLLDNGSGSYHHHRDPPDYDYDHDYDYEGDGLFCRYSIELQRSRHKPLASSFAPGGDRRCPACDARIAAAGPDDAWAITKRVGERVVDVIAVDEATGRERGRDQVVEGVERRFRLGQRFLVKCHAPRTGEFACVLCRRHREADAVCRTAEALAHHVGRAHDVAELEREVDLLEDGPPRQPALLALPPPAPAPPPAVPSPPPASVSSTRAATIGGRDRDREARGEDFELRDRRYALPAKYR